MKTTCVIRICFPQYAARWYPPGNIIFAWGIRTFSYDLALIAAALLIASIGAVVFTQVLMRGYSIRQLTSLALMSYYVLCTPPMVGGQNR
jgi:hypothetical protein